MRCRTFLCGMVFAFVFVFAAPLATFAQGNVHVVQAGETLIGVAARYGVSTSALAAANGIKANGWVYTGQRLVIPGGSSQIAVVRRSYHVVARGETLGSIAQRYGTNVQALVSANGLTSNTIYVGQRLNLPGNQASPAPAAVPAAGEIAPIVLPEGAGVGGERWIDVNITNQTITAYEGQTPVYSAVVSTGIWKYPTVVGTYNIYVKYRSAGMSGGTGADYYNLPNVPYVMYFYRGYGIHGTYWHNNFGTPMSHGCVNLRTTDAEWFFNWASVGTKVVTHY
jgi:LysM repeat protein